MALNRQSLSALFKEVERQVKEDEDAILAARRGASSDNLLTPRKMEEAAHSNQNLVLAYGRMGHTISFTPAELREFLRARKKIAKKYGEQKQGAPLRALLSSSRPIDKRRAKTVKSAVFYKRKRNILFFMVSGIQRPQYRVQIRLEGWDKALTTNTKALRAAQQLVNGRLSIECSCGRHQYWYRYLCTIGGFAIQPQEHDFPKIKNPNLQGCCCKHILKVLDEMQKSRVLFALSKELDKDRNEPGFSGKQGARILTNDQLRITTSRMSAGARQVLDMWRQQADKLKAARMKPKGNSSQSKTQKKNTTPQKQAQKKQAYTQAQVEGVRNFMTMARQQLKITDLQDPFFIGLRDRLAEAQGLSKADVDAIIKDNNL